MSTGIIDSSEKVEIQNAYVQYQRSKGEYLSKKAAKIGGGVLNIPLPHHFAKEWTISGPASFHIYKKGKRVIYLFGDNHGSWENTCYRPGAKPATSLLTYNINCNVKGNCITVQQFIELCAKIADKKKKNVHLFYESSNTNNAISYKKEKAILDKLSAGKEYLSGPIMEVITMASICSQDGTCKSLLTHPIEIRDTSKVVITLYESREKYLNAYNAMNGIVESVINNIPATEKSNLDGELIIYALGRALNPLLSIFPAPINNSNQTNTTLLLNLVNNEFKDIGSLFDRVNNDTKTHLIDAIIDRTMLFAGHVKLSDMNGIIEKVLENVTKLDTKLDTKLQLDISLKNSGVNNVNLNDHRDFLYKIFKDIINPLLPVPTGKASDFSPGMKGR